jgi:hypothetical protein
MQRLYLDTTFLIDLRNIGNSFLQREILTSLARNYDVRVTDVCMMEMLAVLESTSALTSQRQMQHAKRWGRIQALRLALLDPSAIFRLVIVK